MHKVLVVDDEPAVAAVTARVLEQSLGCEIVAATSGAEALALLGAQSFSLLLCDMNMPDMTGVDVLRQARRRRPELVTVLVTGQVDVDGLGHALNDGGIWKYVAKPWRMNELSALARSGLKEHEDRLAAGRPPSAPSSSLPLPASATRSATGRKPVFQPMRRAVIRPGPVRAAAPREREAPADELAAIDRRYRMGPLVREDASVRVYQADDSLLSLPVSIHLISPAVCADAGRMAGILARGRLVMGLAHRHLARLHAINAVAGRVYFVEERVEGSNLGEVLTANGPLDLPNVARIGWVCADALGCAHRHGVVHGHLAPEWLAVDDTGVMKVLDIGWPGADDSIAVGRRRPSAPDVRAGSRPDVRSEVFDLAVLLHEMLTGDVPFPAGPAGWQGEEPTVSVMLPGVVRDVLMRGLAGSREARWPSIESLGTAFVNAANVVAGRDVLQADAGA